MRARSPPGPSFSLGMRPNTSLATQAALQADCGNLNTYVVNDLGGGASSLLRQDCNELRKCYRRDSDSEHLALPDAISINYEMPKGLSSWFRVPRMTIALQGNNLGLSTNYHGKDPNVNAFSTVSAGDETADLGQIPEPRTWWLKISLGN